MKKKYLYEGAFWFFEEGRQPDGAIAVVEKKAEAKNAETQTKAVEPKNKARETEKK